MSTLYTAILLMFTLFAISQDGKYLASGSNDNSIKIWNLNDKREKFTLTGHTSYIYAVAITQDGQFIVSGSDDSTIKIWSIVKKTEVCTLIRHTSFVFTIAISNDSNHSLVDLMIKP